MDSLPLTLTQLQLVVEALELGRVAALKNQLDSIRSKAQELLNHSMNAATLAEATSEYVALCGGIASQLATRSDISSVVASSEAALRDELARLRTKFSGSDGESAIVAATDVLRSFFEVSAKVWLQVLEHGRLDEVNQALAETQTVNWSDPALGLLRGLLLISALTDSERDPDALLDHAEWAYLEVMQGVDAFATAGVSPFTSATQPKQGSERARHTLKYVQEIQKHASAEFVRAIESAHVRNI